MKILNRPICFSLLSVVIIFLFGCTSLHKFKYAEEDEKQTHWLTKEKRYVTITNSNGANRLIFNLVQFDDQGEFWDRNQLSEVVNQIGDQKSKGIPVTSLVFVHGWNHDG